MIMPSDCAYPNWRCLTVPFVAALIDSIISLSNSLYLCTLSALTPYITNSVSSAWILSKRHWCSWIIFSSLRNFLRILMLSIENSLHFDGIIDGPSPRYALISTSAHRRIWSDTIALWMDLKPAALKYSRISSVATTGCHDEINAWLMSQACCWWYFAA